MKLKGIIFDLDGTLADNHAACIGGYAEAVAQLTGRRPDEDEVLSYFGLNEEGILEKMLPGRLEESLPIFLKAYETLHAAAAQPFAGVARLLDLMHARGMRAAIVTGKGQQSADISMRILGLGRWMDAVEVGFADRADKPYSIRKILARWQMCPQDAAYVGDMPSDMRAAHAAGVMALGAAWAQSSRVRGVDCAAAHTFLSLDEMIDWVKKA